ncbi:MAG: alpha/beta fold hydrolase [Thermomicrobiales bacterium]
MPVRAINGTYLNYEVAGESGPPLVLIHGGWGDSSTWESVVSDGFARHFQTVFYDRRGHGRGQPQKDLDADGILVDAEGLAALITALDLAPAHVVGISAGGCVALQLAIRHPALIRRLAVHEPPMFTLLEEDPDLGSTAQSILERMRTVHDLLVAGDFERANREFFAAVAGDPDVWDSISPSIQELHRTNASTFIAESIDPDLFGIDLAALGNATAPTLLTFGVQSPPWFTAVIPILAEAMPNAIVHPLDETGHVPMATRPDLYMDTLIAFLQAHKA